MHFPVTQPTSSVKALGNAPRRVLIFYNSFTRYLRTLLQRNCVMRRLCIKPNPRTGHDFFIRMASLKAYPRGWPGVILSVLNRVQCCCVFAVHRCRRRYTRRNFHHRRRAHRTQESRESSQRVSVISSSSFRHLYTLWVNRNGTTLRLQRRRKNDYVPIFHYDFNFFLFFCKLSNALSINHLSID